MKILITGGAGYIGSVLTPKLLSFRPVRVLDNLLYGGAGMRSVWEHSNFEFIHGTILEPSTLHEAMDGIDVVIHLAAIVGVKACDSRPLAREINYRAAVECAKIARGRGVRSFLFASTCSLYGRQQGDELLTEDSPIEALSLYAETKMNAEREILDLETADFAPVVCRFATVYGLSPRMRMDLMINEFTRDALYNRTLSLYEPNAWRPFVHVSDLSEMLCLLVLGMESRRSHYTGQIYNVGGVNLRKKDIATALERFIPELYIETIKETKDPRNYRVDFSKIQDEIGDRQVHVSTAGIENLIRALEAGIIPSPYAPEWRNA